MMEPENVKYVGENGPGKHSIVMMGRRRWLHPREWIASKCYGTDRECLITGDIIKRMELCFRQQPEYGYTQLVLQGDSVGVQDFARKRISVEGMMILKDRSHD